MEADIQIAGSSGPIVKNLHARRAAGRIFEELNRTAVTRAAVGDENPAAAGRSSAKKRGPAACTANEAAAVGEGAVARSRRGEELREASPCAGGCGAVVGEIGVTAARRIFELGEAAAAAAQ